MANIWYLVNAGSGGGESGQHERVDLERICSFDLGEEHHVPNETGPQPSTGADLGEVGRGRGRRQECGHLGEPLLLPIPGRHPRHRQHHLRGEIRTRTDC